MRGCTICKHATWHLTKTGRIAKGIAGRCWAPIPDLKALLPVCVPTPQPSRDGIWPDMGQHCPSWEGKNQSGDPND